VITEQPGFHAKTTNRDFRTGSGVHVDARRYGSREMTEIRVCDLAQKAACVVRLMHWVGAYNTVVDDASRG